MRKYCQIKPSRKIEIFLVIKEVISIEFYAKYKATQKGSKMSKLMLNFFVFALAVTLTGIGCAPKNFNEPGVIEQSKGETSKIFHANFQDTWKAVTQLTMNYPVISNAKETGILTTDWIKGKSDRLYSGYGETRIPYTIRYKLTVKVKPVSKGTMINVANREQYLTDSVTSGIDMAGSIYQWLDTESSTMKETALLNEIQKLLTLKK